MFDKEQVSRLAAKPCLQKGEQVICRPAFALFGSLAVQASIFQSGMDGTSPEEDCFDVKSWGRLSQSLLNLFQFVPILFSRILANRFGSYLLRSKGRHPTLSKRQLFALRTTGTTFRRGAAWQGHGFLAPVAEVPPEGREDATTHLVGNTCQVDHVLQVRRPRDGISDLAIDQAHGEDTNMTPAAQGVLGQVGVLRSYCMLHNFSVMFRALSGRYICEWGTCSLKIRTQQCVLLRV